LRELAFIRNRFFPVNATPDMDDDYIDELKFLDHKIAAAEDLIVRQQRLVERLRGGGESTVHAEKLLATLREAVQRFREEREVLEKYAAIKPLH
jgi:hypothetical protein